MNDRKMKHGRQFAEMITKEVLTVSCHGGGPVPAPDTVFEGITTTKGFVAYADRGKPAGGVDANRTAFHVVAAGQVDDDDDDDDDD